MHSAYPKSNFPYYGQPYHTYYPPNYQHQRQQQPFPTSDPYNSPPWPRENYQSTPYPQGHLDPNTPFVPPTSEPGPPPARVKRASTTRPKASYNPEKTQLKSAMKKNGGTLRRSDTVGAAPPPLERTRTSSSARQRLVPMTRTSGINSNPSYLPDHMFVSFHGANELRLGNVAFQDTMEEIKENIIPMWPHGVSTAIPVLHAFRILFNRNPWTASGIEGIIAQKMMCELFTCLAHNGYQYRTSLSTGYQYPQLVFQDSGPDEHCDFFAAHISRSGHRITLVRPPRRVGEQIGPRLRNAWPHQIAGDRTSEDEIYTIELKRNAIGTHELSKDVFAASALKEISMMGYKLEATVPLPRSGMLGFGKQKEIWIFRGTRMRSRANSRAGSRSGSRAGQNIDH
ncbi:hypothetical protein DEU56DRAFT_770662 [Suillus clintonianus]|uniref:uncharacterized protein n=1 Tax=Suillus clintonianus TaxID=1904413 RepID=UPI001B8735F1|nr:uncharacterized protein DEU56DRAFT_770662 [Suillus clintonianus]KAG2154829.1 hypothetical protein DEU56DRAFT_770662 [Suillus clintonianus]